MDIRIAIAVDGVVATRIAPQFAVVDLKIVGGIECVVKGIGFDDAAVDEEAVLALNRLAVRVARSLRTIGADIAAVEIDVAFDSDAFGQSFEIIVVSSSKTSFEVFGFK